MRKYNRRPAVTFAPSSPVALDAHQEAVVAFARDGKGSAVVIARAGAGKSTTLEQCVRAVVASRPSALVAVVAFNKKIETAMSARLADLPGVTVKTTHGLGYRMAAGGRKLSTDFRKGSNIVKAKLGPDAKYSERLACERLASLIKATCAESVEDTIALMGEHTIDAGTFTDGDFAARALAAVKDARTNRAQVDFDDMIDHGRMSVRPAFDVIFVDETQDLNEAQLRLILGALRPGGRVIAVGDDRQAIYGWRGASCDAVERVRAAVGGETFLLPVSYRCARAIVAEAQIGVPDILPAPNAGEGTVTRATVREMVAQASPGDFILSRTNAPLLGTALTMALDGRPVRIQGRDLGAELRGFVKRANATTLDALLTYVDAWETEQCERAEKRGGSTDTIVDKARCVRVLCGAVTTIAEYEVKVESLFSDDDDSAVITLSTAHRAKGLERKRVWFLADTFAKVMAGSVKRGASEKKLQEERNCAYVAVTRAQETLVYVEGDATKLGE